MATDSGESVHYRACNLCEAICGLEIRVADGKITSIRGDKEDPFSRGHVCPKAVALQDIHHDPDRLKRPLRRIPATNGGEDRWQEIGWDEAFDLAASRLRAIQDSHGRDAIGFYLGNPNVHNYGNLLYGPPLLRALKSKNRFSATSVDQLPHHFAAYFMFGHQLLLPVPDVDRTDYFLILGANPAVSNGSLMTAPDVKNRIKAIRERGGQVVVIDPRRTETAKLADRHLFLRPGTDALLLMALLHTVFDEDLVEPGRLAEHADGLEQLQQATDGFAPEQVAGAVGMEPDDIRALARDFCAASSAVCYGRMGASTQEFGAVCQWLINAFNFVTGNLDRAGGAMFTKPAVDLVARGFGGGSFGRWKSRVRGLPEFGGELPVSALAEEILTPGEGQIRALVTSAGNPVLSTPNGRQLDEGLASLDFMVSIDFYLNETTRHADLILPPTAALEHDHYDIVFNVLAVRNTARYSPPLFEPEEDTRHDWQILHELRKRLDRNRSMRSRMERWVMGRGPRTLLNLALRSGPTSLNLKKLERAAHGVDLGALEPCLPERLKTREQRIDLAPELLVADVERLRKHLEELDGGSSLVLIGRRQVRSNNSWMHNYQRLMRGKDRCTLLIHPDDAARLGIAEDGTAAVSSRVGRVEAPVELTDAIMPGVVSLPHGWGHHRPGIRLETASSRPGVSLNDLTDEQRIDALCGNAAFSGVPVTVEAVT